MKTVNLKEKDDLSKKGYRFPKAKIPKVEAVDPSVAALRSIEKSLGLDRETLKESLFAIQTQANALTELADKTTPKKKFVLTPTRNKQGYIEKITIVEV